MRLFTGLCAVGAVILVTILAWDLGQERLVYPDKKLIVFADMFGPGEPMQRLYGGPAEATVSGQPFGPDDLVHYQALAAAFPEHRDRIVRDCRAVHRRTFAGADSSAAPAPPPGELVEEYRGLAPAYVRRLVEALGQSDRGNRLRLFYAFAEAHPWYDRRPATQPATARQDGPRGPASLILAFERLHPAWTVGLFEDFERRHPDHKILPRWDGRWVLSANRPRFLTGSDVPDIIVGTLGELRILMRENLALPLDRPLPEAAHRPWRTESILRAERAYGDETQSFESEFYDWALDRSRYTVLPEDVRDSGNPYPAGERVLYFLPRQVHTFVVFYNKAHFRLIGRDPNSPPGTVEEFEAVCRQLLAAGKEPIANDGITYLPMWWDWLVFRTIGNDNYVNTVVNGPGAGRLAGPDADPRYLAIARRLRQWRDQNFWMKGFSSSQWPGAQRDFSNGRCTFLFTGSWLPAEIASSQSLDRNVFDMGCFFFPKVTGGTGDAEAIQVSPQGFCLCRQGQNLESAVLLLRYLVAHGGELLSRRLNYISTTRGVAFPPALADVEPAMVQARSEDFLGDGPTWFAPKFAKFVLGETYPKFFLVRPDGLDPEQFVETLETKAQAHYREFGGQAR